MDRWFALSVRDRVLISALVSAVVFIGWLYTRGAFDEQLAAAGLNWRPCAETPFGTVCGDSLERLCLRPAVLGADACREVEGRGD